MKQFGLDENYVLYFEPENTMRMRGPDLDYKILQIDIRRQGSNCWQVAVEGISKPPVLCNTLFDFAILPELGLELATWLENSPWNKSTPPPQKESCPECYGTGFFKGFGGPCRKCHTKN